MKKFLIVAAMLAFSNTPAIAKPLECRITDKRQCAPNEECKSIPSKVWLLIDKEARTYARCDDGGCNTRDALFAHAGFWTSIDVPGTSSFVKMSDAGDVVEVVSLNSMVLIGYGKCSPVSAP